MGLGWHNNYYVLINTQTQAVVAQGPGLPPHTYNSSATFCLLEGCYALTVHCAGAACMYVQEDWLAVGPYVTNSTSATIHFSVGHPSCARDLFACLNDCFPMKYEPFNCEGLGHMITGGCGKCPPPALRQIKKECLDQNCSRSSHCDIPSDVIVEVSYEVQVDIFLEGVNITSSNEAALIAAVEKWLGRHGITISMYGPSFNGARRERALTTTSSYVSLLVPAGNETDANNLVGVASGPAASSLTAILATSTDSTLKVSTCSSSGGYITTSNTLPDTYQPTQVTSSSSGSKTAIIIGAVIGAVVAVAIVIALTVYFHKRHKEALGDHRQLTGNVAMNPVRA